MAVAVVVTAMMVMLARKLMGKVPRRKTSSARSFPGVGGRRMTQESSRP